MEVSLNTTTLEAIVVLASDMCFPSAVNRAPKIANPAYKGPWAPRKIENPNYFEDKTPSNFEPIGAVGIEIWTMQKDSAYRLERMRTPITLRVFKLTVVLFSR